MLPIRRELDRLVVDALSDEPRLALAAARQLAAQQGWIEQRAVALARRHGMSWAVIGRLLGITRQSARERFATMRPTTPPPPPRPTWGWETGEEVSARLSRDTATARRWEAFSTGDDVVVPW
jgi:hypothetical protein